MHQHETARWTILLTFWCLHQQYNLPLYGSISLRSILEVMVQLQQTISIWKNFGEESPWHGRIHFTIRPEGSMDCSAIVWHHVCCCSLKIGRISCWLCSFLISQFEQYIHWLSGSNACLVCHLSLNFYSDPFPIIEESYKRPPFL
jgi:hypothetical protein